MAPLRCALRHGRNEHRPSPHPRALNRCAIRSELVLQTGRFDHPLTRRVRRQVHTTLIGTTQINTQPWLHCVRPSDHTTGHHRGRDGTRDVAGTSRRLIEAYAALMTKAPGALQRARSLYLNKYPLPCVPDASLRLFVDEHLEETIQASEDGKPSYHQIRSRPVQGPGDQPLATADSPSTDSWRAIVRHLAAQPRTFQPSAVRAALVPRQRPPVSTRDSRGSDLATTQPLTVFLNESQRLPNRVWNP